MMFNQIDEDEDNTVSIKDVKAAKSSYRSL